MTSSPYAKMGALGMASPDLALMRLMLQQDQVPAIKIDPVQDIGSGISQGMGNIVNAVLKRQSERRSNMQMAQMMQQTQAAEALQQQAALQSHKAYLTELFGPERAEKLLGAPDSVITNEQTTKREADAAQAKQDADAVKATGYRRNLMIQADPTIQEMMQKDPEYAESMFSKVYPAQAAQINSMAIGVNNGSLPGLDQIGKLQNDTVRAGQVSPYYKAGADGFAPVDTPGGYATAQLLGGVTPRTTSAANSDILDTSKKASELGVYQQQAPALAAQPALQNLQTNQNITNAITQNALGVQSLNHNPIAYQLDDASKQANTDNTLFDLGNKGRGLTLMGEYAHNGGPLDPTTGAIMHALNPSIDSQGLFRDQGVLSGGTEKKPANATMRNKAFPRLLNGTAPATDSPAAMGAPQTAVTGGLGGGALPVESPLSMVTNPNDPAKANMTPGIDSKSLYAQQQALRDQQAVAKAAQDTQNAAFQSYQNNAFSDGMAGPQPLFTDHNAAVKQMHYLETQYRYASKPMSFGIDSQAHGGKTYYRITKANSK